jgi:hypothetical protein
MVEDSSPQPHLVEDWEASRHPGGKESTLAPQRILQSLLEFAGFIFFGL